jgi:hypothetical protein
MSKVVPVPLTLPACAVIPRTATARTLPSVVTETFARESTTVNLPSATLVAAGVLASTTAPPRTASPATSLTTAKSHETSIADRTTSTAMREAVTTPTSP